MTYHWGCNKSNTTGCGAETSGAEIHSCCGAEIHSKTRNHL